MADQSTVSTDQQNQASIKQLAMRACGTCVKAKVKCIPNVKHGKCHRCQRLNKHCQPSTPASRRRPPSNQVAQLERKVDSLVTLLTAPKNNPSDQCVPVSTNPGSTISNEPNHHVSKPSAAVLSSTSQSGASSSQYECAGSSATPLSTPEAAPYHPCASKDDIGFKEASLLLLEFRTQMSPQFPFVIIPADMTSETLRQQKPMLWKAVMTAASYHNPQRQASWGRNFMEELSSRLLMKAEKSLDLLQAILVHLAWYHYHTIESPQVVNLLSLMKSLITQLGYSRTRSTSKLFQLLVNGPTWTAIEPSDRQPTSLALEEWRALAGSFFLSTMTMSGCMKSDALIYTSHLEHVCKILAEKQEYESDRMILPIVSIQHLITKINNVFSQHGSSLSSGLIRMHTRVLYDELQLIKQNIPDNIMERRPISTCYQLAEIYLYEIGLARSFWTENDKVDRITTMYSCLQAVKTFTTTHFSSTSSLPASHAYFGWIFCGYTVLMALKLSVSDAEGWDTEHAREVLDFPGFMYTVVGKLENIVQLRSPQGKSDIFTWYLRQMHCIKHYGASLATTQAISSNPIESTIANSRGLHDEMAGYQIDLPNFDSQSYIDDLFLNFEGDFWEGLDNNGDWAMNIG